MIHPDRGGAKNSARRGYSYALRLLRAGFEPCRGFEQRPRFMAVQCFVTRTSWSSHVHGATQNRRGDVSTVSNTLGAPSSSPHRVLRPTGSGGHTSGQGAYIGSGARTRQKWQNHPSRTRTTTRTRTIGGAHAPLMIPKLAESVGPVAILDPLAGPIAHLLAQV